MTRIALRGLEYLLMLAIAGLGFEAATIVTELVLGWFDVDIGHRPYPTPFVILEIVLLIVFVFGGAVLGILLGEEVSKRINPDTPKE